jgi:origin recognition complex subunit 2
MPRAAYEYDEERSSSEDEDEIEQELIEGSDEESDNDELPVPQTPSRRKGKGKVDELEDKNLIVQTTFDAYFTYSASRTQTSSNVYTQLVLPLTGEEYVEGIASSSKRLKPLKPSILEPDSLKDLFSRFIFELNEGFNLLCYGYGSKRRVLNQFASEVCSKHGHVVVANAFQPDFTIKDLLSRIHTLPPVQDLVLGATAEKQAGQIAAHLSKQTQHVYIVIHNIDALPLRSTRSKTVLSLLASNPRIHVIASVDHLNTSLLWSSSELFARKSDTTDDSTSISAFNYTTDAASNPSYNANRGFAWLWHDLSTLSPYDAELAFADRSSIAGASSASRRKGALDAASGAAAGNPAAMSETAASHILASVTQKAKKLFILLGKRQLAAIEDAEGDQQQKQKVGGGAAGASQDLQQYGMAYDVLFNGARDDFIAANDGALRSLLAEFRDHGLVLSAPSATGGAEVLWIPLRKERLVSVIQSLETGTA